MTSEELSMAFDARWVRDPSSGCWLWTGAMHSNGYGLMSTGSRNSLVRAHRLALELAGVAVPAGMDVCHRCDTPPCVNPSHLFVGSRLDNMRDAKRKGRTCSGPARARIAARGERHGNTRLSAEQVIELRGLRDEGVPFKQLAERFGISASGAHAIASRKTWRHL